MERERTMVAEQIQRPPARHAAHEHASLALIQIGARLLARVRGGEVAHAMLQHFDRLGHRTREQLHIARESFAAPHAHVVPREDPFRAGQLSERGHDRCAKRLEAGREELHDQPTIEAIHHERRQPVPFAMDESAGVRLRIKDSRAARDRGRESAAPPIGIERDLRLGGDEAERDLRRRTPERDAERPAGLIRQLQTGIFRCLGCL